MIQLRILGRAGNQFFQFATLKSFMKDNDITEKIYISFQELEKRKTDNLTFENVLKYFQTGDFEIIDRIKMSYKQQFLDYLYRGSLKILRTFSRISNKKMSKRQYDVFAGLLQKLLNRNGLYYYFPGSFKFYPSKNDNIIFYGNFESKLYFDSNKELIRDIFMPKNSVLEKNKDIYSVINNTNSVCVTIRRGDFLNPEFKKDFYICSPEYFEKAIDEMKKMITNPKFIIFSDDIQWCKENIKLPENSVYESGNDPIWEKIRMMYSCKHFIISNSTFSWWAQYLSKNSSKIVIAPKVWNNFEYMDLIYDENWKLI